MFYYVLQLVAPHLRAEQTVMGVFTSLDSAKWHGKRGEADWVEHRDVTRTSWKLQRRDLGEDVYMMVSEVLPG